MAWSGGTFTRANPTWASDAQGGLGIEPGRHDAQDNDFTTGINQCINKDGSNAMTGNLNLNTNKIVGLANGTNSTDATSWGQLTNGAPLHLDTVNNRVGVGTTTPGVLFDAVRSGNDAGTRLRIRNPNVGSSAVTLINLGNDLNADAGHILYQSNAVTTDPGPSGMAVMNNLAGALNLGTSGLTRINITNDGRVGINTTSPSATHVMTVAGDIRVTNQGLSYPGVATYIGPTVGSNNIGFAWDSPNIWAAVDNSAAAIVGTVSDYRLKDGFTPVSTTLNKIKNLNVGTYQPKEFDGTVKNTTCCGVLAHEAAVQFPDLVTGEKDAETEDGKPRYQSFNYAGLTPYLVVAIKELLAKVEELEARLPEVSEPA
jgi:hypothetical protein